MQAGSLRITGAPSTFRPPLALPPARLAELTFAVLSGKNLVAKKKGTFSHHPLFIATRLLPFPTPSSSRYFSFMDVSSLCRSRSLYPRQCHICDR